MRVDRERMRRMMLYVKYIVFCIEKDFELEELYVSEDKVMDDRMLTWFSYEHLPENLQVISKPFCELATRTCNECDPGPERTVALRKLLEAKDAAVRAKLNPGS